MKVGFKFQSSEYLRKKAIPCHFGALGSDKFLSEMNCHLQDSTALLAFLSSGFRLG